MPGRRTDDGKEKQYTVLKVRLYPTAAQATLMDKTFGCCRYLWNRMLADVQEFYAATDIHYIPTPARYKKEAPFLTEVDSQALCAVHQNLRKAFLDFFRAPKHFGYPQFKAKRYGKNSFTVYSRKYRTGPSIQLLENEIQMPKLGRIRAAIHREVRDDWHLCSVTVSKTRTEKYYASLSFKCESARPAPIIPAPEKTLGINHSFTYLYVDSSGNRVPLPEYLRRSQKKLARMQAKLLRMQRGSKNYAEQLQKVRLLIEHITNQRKDFIHKESRRLADSWDAICVRENDLQQFSQKVKWYTFDNGFGMLRENLKYKLLQQGKRYIPVDPYTSVAKTCHRCGYLHKGLTIREKSWICPGCGAALSRDVNAAKNIRILGLFQLRALNKETRAESAVS